jgi:hypothetical protein
MDKQYNYKQYNLIQDELFGKKEFILSNSDCEISNDNISNNLYFSTNLYNSYDTPSLFEESNPLVDNSLINNIANCENSFKTIENNSFHTDLEESLIFEPVDLCLLFLINNSLKLNNLIYGIILVFMNLFVLSIYYNNSSLIAFIIYGFIINLMVGFLILRLPEPKHKKIEDLISLYSISFEKKIVILLLCIGIGCQLSWLAWLLFIQSWFSLLSIFFMVIFFHLYIKNFLLKLKDIIEIDNISIKQLQKEHLDLLETNILKYGIGLSFIFGLIDLIIISNIKSFGLGMLLNIFIVFIYHHQLKTIILKCKSIWFGHENLNTKSNLNIDIVRIVLSNLIEFYGFIIEIYFYLYIKLGL